MRSPEFSQRPPEFNEVSRFALADLFKSDETMRVNKVIFQTKSGNEYTIIFDQTNGSCILKNKQQSVIDGLRKDFLLTAILALDQPFDYEEGCVNPSQRFDYPFGGLTASVTKIEVYRAPNTSVRIRTAFKPPFPPQPVQPKNRVETKEKAPEIITSAENDKDTPVIIGDLEKDGFKILSANQESGQDAWAVSADRRRFVVCDGMGSYTRSGQVAREVAKAVAEFKGTLAEFFPNGETFEEVTVNLRKILEKIKFKPDPAAVKWRQQEEVGHTTLTVLEKEKDGSWFCIIVGDSPLYCKYEGEEWQGKGNDSIGITSAGVALGVEDGKARINFGQNSEKLIRSRIPAEPRMKFMLASDWFSDNVEAQSQDYAKRQIKEYQQQLADARKNGYFMYNNAGTQERIEDERKLKNYIHHREHWIEKYKLQLDDSIRKPLDPFCFKDLKDPKELLEIVKGNREDIIKVRKPDDATMILVDGDKIK